MIGFTALAARVAAVRSVLGRAKAKALAYFRDHPLARFATTLVIVGVFVTAIYKVFPPTYPAIHAGLMAVTFTLLGIVARPHLATSRAGRAGVRLLDLAVNNPAGDFRYEEQLGGRIARLERELQVSRRQANDAGARANKEKARADALAGANVRKANQTARRVDRVPVTGETKRRHDQFIAETGISPAVVVQAGTRPQGRGW